ncbi:hypothetical protein L7F22_039819 [Adiantum nelumboides]|nr:hypothetical protein [Adiantum nelumboides]
MGKVMKWAVLISLVGNSFQPISEGRGYSRGRSSGRAGGDPPRGRDHGGSQDCRVEGPGYQGHPPGYGTGCERAHRRPPAGDESYRRPPAPGSGDEQQGFYGRPPPGQYGDQYQGGRSQGGRGQGRGSAGKGAAGRQWGDAARGSASAQRNQPSESWEFGSSSGGGQDIASSSSAAPPYQDYAVLLPNAMEDLHLGRPVEVVVEGGKNIEMPAANSKCLLVPPSRPPAGKAGAKALVKANHFLVKFEPKMSIYHYDVDIVPKLSSKAVARCLKDELLRMYGADFQDKLLVYDGRKNLYCAGPLPFVSREFKEVFSKENNKTYKMTIRRVNIMDMTDILEFLSGRKATAPNQHLQALDVALREASMSLYVPIGRSFFTKDLGHATLDGGLTAWNGFFQSLRLIAQGLAVNVDMVTTAFYESIPVIDYLCSKVPHFNPQNRLNVTDWAMMKKDLEKLKIEVIHRQTCRKYRISGLSPGPTRGLKFSTDSGAEMTIVEYFKNYYNLQLKYLELPCLQVQAKKTTYLPMEVCKIVEGQRYMGKLLENQTKALRRLACVRPSERENKIRTIMSMPTGPGCGKFVASFGLEISRDLTMVPARILRAPKLKYGAHGALKEIEPCCGAWNLNRSCFIEGGTVEYWAVISFDRRMNDPAFFIEALSRRCRELGMQFNPRTIIPPLLCSREDLEASRLERSLKNVCMQASQAITALNDPRGSLQLLVCLMGERHPAYGEIKRLCETQLGVMTQCCLTKNLWKPNSQFLANLAHKINPKVGGRNNTLAVELPQLCHVFKQPTIIFGADVTHPDPGDNSSPSIAALVANVDWPSATKYVATARAQSHREEMIENLQGMVQELWHKFCDKTKLRPERVVMFRDGVSEGQFEMVLQDELHAMKEAMVAVGGPNYMPKITWIVVQKRHHTRLFPGDQNKDKSNNVMPGTVVDSVITHPHEFDFYLCSHAGIQGTSKPTHYHVLWDENSFSSDDLQAFSYNLCHTYSRCARSVSVVPPAYYAHHAAYRARLYIQGQRGSDSASYTSGQPSPLIRSLPLIKKNVEEFMYFC